MAREMSPRQHSTAAEVEGLFLSPMLQGPDSQVLHHLVEGCPVCGDLAANFWQRLAGAHKSTDVGSTAEDDGDWFDEAWSRVLPKIGAARRRLASERAEAKRVLPQLLAQPFPRQLMLVHNSRKFKTWGLCELLLEEGWAQRFRAPDRTETLSRLAVAISSELQPGGYGADRLNDLRGRCWIALANGRRILGDFMSANAALDQAQRLLALGTGGLVERAHWLDIRSSLSIAQRDLAAADRAAALASGIYFEIRDCHGLGSSLLRRATIAEALFEVERAIVFGRAGLELIDAERDPSLLLGGWLNLIRSLHSAGRHREAFAALGRARPAYIESGDRTTFLRFQWLEGSVAAALGREEQAEGCLRETRAGFLQLGIAHDAAIVSLDLAGLLARQGRNAEVCQLATEMIAIFESRDSRTEGLAALILLRQAGERERITEALLQRLRGSLRESRTHA